MPTKLTPRRITVDEYHRMAEAGILAEDESTELINGEILRMSAVGGRHVEVVGKLTHLLVQVAGTEWRVNVQSPISLPPCGEPQPDFALVQARSYCGKLPQAEDVLIEPMSGIYTTTKTAGPGMEIESAVLPGLTLDVDTIVDLESCLGLALDTPLPQQTDTTLRDWRRGFESLQVRQLFLD